MSHGKTPKAIDMTIQVSRGRPKFVLVECESLTIQTIGENRYEVYIDGKKVDGLRSLKLELNIESLPVVTYQQILKPRDKE